MHITFAGHTINYTDNNNSNFFGTTTAEIEVGRGGLNSPLTLGAPPDSLNSLFIRKVRETAHHLGIWRSHSSLGGIRPGMRFLHEHNTMNIIIVQQQQMYNNRKSCGGKDPVSFSCSSRLVLRMVWHMPLYSIVHGDNSFLLHNGYTVKPSMQGTEKVKSNLSLWLSI